MALMQLIHLVIRQDTQLPFDGFAVHHETRRRDVTDRLLLDDILREKCFE